MCFFVRYDKNIYIPPERVCGSLREGELRSRLPISKEILQDKKLARKTVDLGWCEKLSQISVKLQTFLLETVVCSLAIIGIHDKRSRQRPFAQHDASILVERDNK